MLKRMGKITPEKLVVSQIQNLQVRKIPDLLRNISSNEIASQVQCLQCSDVEERRWNVTSERVIGEKQVLKLWQCCKPAVGNVSTEAVVCQIHVFQPMQVCELMGQVAMEAVVTQVYG
ncbi:hypothetical protein OIU78_024787 [Salix suchowensis]|nr:hypothetical protein OIU78_024787 [Salix suchowensis]